MAIHNGKVMMRMMANNIVDEVEVVRDAIMI